MSLDITGKLIQKLPLLSGTSKTGNNWQKQEFVIETIESYPKKICANLWGDRIDQLNAFNIGDLITISFDLESREFNGRWYTDVKAWKVIAPATMPQMSSAAVTPAPTPTNLPLTGMPASTLPNPDDSTYLPEENSTDDLPF